MIHFLFEASIYTNEHKNELLKVLCFVCENVFNGSAHLGPLQDVDDLFVGGAAALVLGPFGQHGKNLL